MKKNIFAAIVIVSLVIAGCAKKQEETLNLLPEETTVGVSSQVAEVTSTISAQDVAKTIVTAKTITSIEEPQKTLESTITTKPSATEIQQALKNAGYYKGRIDGDIGPMSEQAIKDFQAANNLKADGVVGTITWSKLKDYLNSPATTTSENKY